jgi:type I restriction enzyme, S subunit
MSITSEWTKGKIGDICIVGDGAHAKVERQISGVMYLTSKNLKGSRLDISQVSYISETDFNKHFRDESKALTKVKPNDVILGIIGTIGEPYIVNSRDRFGISSSVAILRPNKSVLFPKYLFYWIENRIFQNALYAIKGGVAQGYVSLEMIRSLPLYYPQLSIQNKIASILSNYDDLIENNTRRIEILEEMAKLIYDEWFVKFRFPGHENVKMVPSELGGIPEGWKVTKLDDVCSTISSGGTPARKTSIFWEDGNILWFKTKELTDGYLFQSEEMITYEGLKNSSAKLFSPGTIIVAIYGVTVGRLGILTKSSTFNQAACGLIPNTGILKISFLFFKLLEMRDYFKSLAQGAAQQNINVSKVRGAKIIFPPIKMVKTFDSLVGKIMDEIKILSAKNQNLRKTRDLLLPKLISGEIDVSDLNIRIRSEIQES